MTAPRERVLITGGGVGIGSATKAGLIGMKAGGAGISFSSRGVDERPTFHPSLEKEETR